MPYPTNWFPHKKDSVQVALNQMAWRALHLICEHDNLDVSQLAHKLSITPKAAGQLARSLRTKHMIEYVGTRHKRTYKLTHKADQQIFTPYE